MSNFVSPCIGCFYAKFKLGQTRCGKPLRAWNLSRKGKGCFKVNQDDQK